MSGWVIRRGALAMTMGVAIALALIGPAHAVYPPIFPPSAPLNVLATPGDAEAVITWQPPASDGGSPILGYRVTSTPATAGCTVDPTVRSCLITGLTNGTSYTFFVTANNAAGFGLDGVSNAITPASDQPVITATGARTATTVSVVGATENVPAGATLTSSVRIEGNASYTPGPSTTVGADGTFAWSATVPADKGVDVFFTYEGVDSNVVSLPADAQVSLAIGGSRNGESIALSGIATNVAAGSTVSIFAQVQPATTLQPAGTATVGDGGLFTWTGRYPAAQGVNVVADFNGVRSNVLAFPGEDAVAIVIAGSRTPNGRNVTVTGSTVGLAPSSAVEPVLTLDGEVVAASPVTVAADGTFTWTRRVGVNRTATISFRSGDVSSNVVTLAAGEPSIGILGERVGGTISVTGQTAGIPERTRLTPFVKADGDAGFLPGTPVIVDAEGAFTWSQPLASTVGATIYFTGGGATSNTVVIPASASTVVLSGTRTGTTIALSGIVTNPGESSRVSIRTRAYGATRFTEAGTATVAANGSFTFSLTAELTEGIAVFAQVAGARSNTLSFDPLAPTIIVLGARFTSARSLAANGQAFNVPVGTVLVPFVSLNGGRFTTGVGVRTLGVNGDFAWQREVTPDRTTAELYFSTVDGVRSNSVTVRRS